MVGIFGGSGRCSRCCPREEKFYFSHEVVAALNRDKEAPWADWKKGEQKGITTKRLSSILKPFKIKSEEPRIDGKRARGYWLESFKDAFESYLEPEKIDF